MIRLKILKLFKSRFFSNSVWLYLLQIFNTVMPLLTLPYVTRIFGAERYGVFSIAFNIYGYIQVIIEYGFIMSATRKMAINPNDMNMASRLFSSVFIARILLALLCTAMTVLYVLIFHDYSAKTACLFIMSLCSFGYCLQINWFFQGISDMKYISLTTIFARSFILLCIFIFVKSSSDIYLYSFLMTILPIVYGSVGLIIANKKYSLHFTYVSFQTVIDELKDGFLVFTTSFSSKILSSVGITLLAFFADASEVGIYSAIQKIPNIMVFIWFPLGQILYPIASRKMTESFIDGKKFVYKMRKLIMLPFILLVITISLLSKQIIRIAFGNEFIIYYYWCIPLLLWLLVAINNNFLGHQILIGGGFDKSYSKCFQITICASMLINFTLIYFFRGDGASLSPLLSELLLTFLELREINKIERKECVK